MSVVLTNLTKGTAASGTSQATASVSPTGNRLELLGVLHARGSGNNITTPTASGNGLTWVQIATQVANTSNWRLTLFRAMVASPSSGATTIDFGGQNQDQGIGWFYNECAGVVTTGANGADAVVQNITGGVAGPNSGLTLTLSAFGNSNNAAYGIVASQGASITVGAGFTAISTQTITASNMQDEWQNHSDNTVDWTWGVSGADSPGIAIEIKAQNSGFFPLL